MLPWNKIVMQSRLSPYCRQVLKDFRLLIEKVCK